MGLGLALPVGYANRVAFAGLFINRHQDVVPDTGWVAYFRNIVVTTAHTFYKKGRWRKESGKRLSQDDFLFYMGGDPSHPRAQDTYGIKKTVVGTRHPYRDDAADYAVVVLERYLPDHVRPAKVMATDRWSGDPDSFDLVNVAYHLDVDGAVWPSKMRGRLRQKGNGSAHFSNQLIVYHGLNTGQSASGSPLIAERGGNPYVIGMHEGNFGRNLHAGRPYQPNRHFNYALKIDGDLLTTLRSVIREEHGVDILVPN
jgi:hypothetical protein